MQNKPLRYSLSLWICGQFVLLSSDSEVFIQNDVNADNTVLHEMLNISSHSNNKTSPDLHKSSLELIEGVPYSWMSIFNNNNW